MSKSKAISTRSAKCAAPAHLAETITRAREQFAKLRDSDKENALRGIFLGGLFTQLKQAAGHGNFERIAKDQMAEIPKRTRVELMRLWAAFVREAKVALPKELAIPDAQLALSLGGGEGPAAEVTAAALRFVGDLSLHALLVEHEVRDKKKLGGAREGADAKPGPVDPEQLAAHAKAELTDAVETLRQLLLTDNVSTVLSKEEIRAVDQSIHGIHTQWRRHVRDALK